ncbi:MAG: hypothetical protein ISR73_09210 [Gammaproteobacteria bacterium]|nr:hypothetical protein [Gammaproteobacteria bacterium]
MMDKKTKNTEEPKPATEPAMPENADLTNVDKIRDILFGNQMRDYDRKFNQLEERIASDLSNLRKENALQIESLQTFLESEIEILGSKLSSEEKTRVNEMDNLDELISKNVRQIDQKISELGSTLDTQTRETNQKMLKQSQDFNTELASQIEQTRKRLDDYKQDLSSGKVDKSVLAEMLNTLALQINSEA